MYNIEKEFDLLEKKIKENENSYKNAINFTQENNVPYILLTEEEIIEFNENCQKCGIDLKVVTLDENNQNCLEYYLQFNEEESEEENEQNEQSDVKKGDNLITDNPNNYLGIKRNKSFNKEKDDSDEDEDEGGDKNEEYKQLDMKFKFNNDSILNKYITYGFILLPSDIPEFIAQGKYYTSFNPNLTVRFMNHTEIEETIPNPYYENAISRENQFKPHFAFIFSIDSEKKIGNYSFAINSEIINVFLIVSIVIALIFAIITFFLIRRKQSSESTNIEGDNLLKGNEKEENEEKGEQETENKEEKEEQAEQN